MNNKLQLIVKESGLETIKAQYILDKFTGYFEMAAEWERKAKDIVVMDENNKVEMQMARVGRLFLRDKRIGIEKTRVELKEQALREGKAIDGIANVLKALIIPIEEYLDKQERFVELKEFRLAEEKRIEEERRVEQERLAREEADRKEQERIRIENIKLKEEAEERERKMEEERKIAEELARVAKEKADKQLAEEKARAEEERIRLEKIAMAEKEKADKIIAIQRARLESEKADRERVQKLLDEQIECPFCHKKFNKKI